MGIVTRTCEPWCDCEIAPSPRTYQPEGQHFQEVDPCTCRVTGESCSECGIGNTCTTMGRKHYPECPHARSRELLEQNSENPPYTAGFNYVTNLPLTGGQPPNWPPITTLQGFIWELQQPNTSP